MFDLGIILLLYYMDKVRVFLITYTSINGSSSLLGFFHVRLNQFLTKTFVHNLCYPCLPMVPKTLNLTVGTLEMLNFELLLSQPMNIMSSTRKTSNRNLFIKNLDKSTDSMGLNDIHHLCEGHSRFGL